MAGKKKKKPVKPTKRPSPKRLESDPPPTLPPDTDPEHHG